MDVGIKFARGLLSYRVLQLREDKVQRTKFFRFQSLIEINKSLKRVMRLVTPDGSAYELLKYEQLPTFFFLCGLIGHLYRNCPKAKGNDPDVNAIEYGS